MKVITVIASPRKYGNCSTIVKEMTKGIQENKGENTIYYVDDMNIKPCQGCKACRNPKKPSKCIINDDFRKVMDEMEKSDALIFAAPNYFGEINAQGHIFMDRFYSMTKSTPNQLKGNKKAVIIFTYGAKTGTYDEYIQKRARLFESIGIKVHEILSVGDGKPLSGNSEELLERARQIGREISVKRNDEEYEIIRILRSKDRVLKAEIMSDELKKKITKLEMKRLDEMVPVINKGLKQAFDEKEAITVVIDNTDVDVSIEDYTPSLTLQSNKGTIIGEEIYDPNELEELKHNPNVYFISDYFATYPNLSVPGEKQFFVVSELEGELDYEDELKNSVSRMVISSPSTEADHYIKKILNIPQKEKITTLIIGFTE